VEWGAPRLAEFVAELNALQAKVDAAKALQTENAFKIDVIMPAIVDKASKGEL
jgi:hypothetical protein